MLNSLNKTNDFIKSEEITAFPLVCSKYLSPWTGLGRSDFRLLVEFCMFWIPNWFFDEISI